MNDKRQRIKTIWQFGKKHIFIFLIAEICILVSYTVSVLLPLNTKELTDRILYEEQYHLFSQILWNYAVLFIIATVFNFIYAFAWQYLNNHYVLDIKNKSFKQVITAKASFLTGMNSGDIMTRIDWDSEQFIHVVQRNLFHFVNSIFMSIGIVIIIVQIDAVIAILLVFAASLPILLTRFFGRFTEKYTRAARETTGELTGKTFELIHGLREIRLLSAYKPFVKRILYFLQKLILSGNDIRRIDFIVNKVTYFINLTTSIIIYGYSVHLVLEQEMTIGIFLAVIEYIALMHKKFNWMLRIYLDWFGRKISIDRVNELLSLDNETDTGISLTKIDRIEFLKVNFSYKQNVPVLKDVSFCIRRGEKIGIIGVSGSGKSTIVSLMLKLYAPEAGLIRINDHPIEAISVPSLRQAIGVVSQDIMLFEDSLRFNLTFGEIYDDNQLWETLQAVNMYDTVQALPDKLDTIIGKTSRNLSGGQKQRLMIARMLLKKPKVVILDEATSALDVETEEIIIRCLEEQLPDTTMLVISHRMAAIRNMDRIFVLHEHQMKEISSSAKVEESAQLFSESFGGAKK